MANTRPLRAALQLSIIDGSLYSIYWSIVAGAIINSFMLSLGAEPMHLAILNGLPSLGALFALPAARIIQSRDIRKPFALTVFFIGRIVWIFVPLILLFPPSPTLQVWFVLLISLICQTTAGAGGVAWISWVSDLVPEGIRGVYFGTRSAFASFVGMIGVTIASVWADSVKAEFGAGRKYIDTLLILISVSVIFAMASWLCLYFQPVRRMKNLVTNGWHSIWDGLKTPNGKRIAISWMTFAFATGLSAGLYTVAMLDRFNITLTGMASYGWIALVLSTLTTPVWGRVADRFGNRVVLRIAWAGVFWQPLLFVFTPYDMPHILNFLPITIMIDAVAGGIFWPAVGLSQTNLVIAEAPSQTRAGLFALLGALTGTIAFISVTLGGLITKAIGANTFDLGIVVLDDIRTVMLAGMILRVIAGILIFRVQEPPRKRAPIPTSQAFKTMVRLVVGRG